MKEMSNFEWRERVFLAGCIKNVIMADRRFDEIEMNELDKLLKDLNFLDYEGALEEFEDNIHDSDTFWESARQIENPATQDLILEVLYDLSIQDGKEELSEKHLISQLKETWRI